MKIKSLIGTVFVFYLILMIGFNEPALAAIVWSAQTSGTTLNLFGVSAVDANTAWAVGLLGEMLYTTDAGTTWTAQTSGIPSITLLGVSAVDANTAFAVGGLGTIIYTTNAGTTWTDQTTGTELLFAVSAVDANTAWVVGELGTILYTTDAGATWNTQSSGTTEDIRDVSAVDENTAFAVGELDTILYTIDGGATWTAQTSGTTDTLLGVSAVDANTAWVVGSGLPALIIYTTDGGTTWTAQSSGTTNFLTGVSAVDANTAWVVGDLGTILYTTDAGTTWSEQTSGTTELLTRVSAVDENIAWAVGFSGTILKSFDSATVIASLSVTGGCELDLSGTTVPFLPGNPIDNGAGVGTGQITVTIGNPLGNLGSLSSAFGGAWTDPASILVPLMDGSHSVVSTSSGTFGSKTPLSTNSLSPTPIGTIPVTGTLDSFWDVEIVLDGADPGYSGPLQQLITFDFTCV